MKKLLLEQTDLSVDNCCCAIINSKLERCKQPRVKDQFYCSNHKRYEITECPVCLEEQLENELPFSCGHRVHRLCFFKWGKDICPICRAKVELSDEDKKERRKYAKPSTDGDLNSVLTSILNQLISSNDNLTEDESDMDQQETEPLTEDIDDETELINSILSGLSYIRGIQGVRLGRGSISLRIFE